MKKMRSYPMKFDFVKFRNGIQSYKDALDMKSSDIDALAGIGNGNTSNILAGQENSKMKTWLSIANALDMDVRTYFVLED